MRTFHRTSRWALRLFSPAAAVALLLPLSLGAAEPAAHGPATIDQGPAPAWVVPLKWTLPSDPPPARMPAEVILTDAQDRLTMNGGDYYYHYVVRLLNAEGVRQNAEQSVSFEPSYEHITWHSLRIIRAGVVSERLATTEFKQLQRELSLEAQIYTGVVTNAAVLEDVRVGDILEYEYTLHSANPVLQGHLSARHGVGSVYPTRRQTVLIQTPASEPEPAWSFFVPPGTKNLPPGIFHESALRLALEKPRRLADNESKGSEEPPDPNPLPVVEGERVYRWSAENIPPIVFDGNVPSSATPYYPMIRCDSYAGWASVVDWAEPMFANAMASMPDDMNKLIRQWQQESPQRSAQLAAAVHWVQNDVRYFAYAMGEHNLRPRPLAEISSSRLGDCKDKAVLLAAVLRKLGFEAWPALTNTYWGDRIKEHGPSPYAFNHAIVAYRYENKLHWLDATLKRQGGAPGTWAVPPYGWALILRPGETELSALPPPDMREPDTTTRNSFTIDPASGEATMDCEVKLQGLQADFYRQDIETTTPEQLSSRWFNFIVRFYKHLQEVEGPSVQDDPVANEIVVRAKYRLPDFLQTEGGVATLSTYAYALRSHLDPPESRRRHWPYALPEGRFLRQRIEVELPFDLATEQQPEVIAFDGLEYRVEKGLAGRHFTAVHDLRVTGDFIAADRMDGFCSAVDEVLNVLGTTLHQHPPAAATTPPSDPPATP